MKKLLTLLASALLAGSAAAQTAAPTLIPFQGRLTDQNGVAYTNNQYTIVFQLYDQAVGGTLLWSERHEKVGVLNGMVNVFLGSIATLTNVSFSSTRYLGITVDGDNNPNTPDPEMVPRQMIIPVFWAKQAENSSKLNGYDWTPLFGVNNPSGSINGGKILAGSIQGSHLATGSVSNAHLSLGAVTASAIAVGAVQSAALASGSVTLDKLGARAIRTNSAGLGEIVVSTPSTSTYNFNSGSPATNTLTDYSVTLTTSGRPVELAWSPSSGTDRSYVFLSSPSGGGIDTYVELERIS